MKNIMQHFLNPYLIYAKDDGKSSEYTVAFAAT